MELAAKHAAPVSSSSCEEPVIKFLTQSEIIPLGELKDWRQPSAIHG